MGAASRLRLIRSPLRWACGITALVFPSAAFGAGSSYRLQLVRAEGAADCPSAAQVERDVTKRLGRNPFSEQGERGIEVVVERALVKWQARLYLRVDAGEDDAVRLIESDAVSCAELGKSVALAVALAIAPDLPAQPRPAPAPRAVEPAPCKPQPPRILPAPATLHGELSLRGMISPNLLPVATSGGTATESASPGAALSITLRGKLIGAAFGGIFFPQRELSAPDAHLGFGLTAGFVSGCLWARVAEPQIWSCIGARVGALHSVVFAPEPVQPGDRFWWAASSELGLRQHLFGRMFIEGGVAAVFPLVRHRFEVDASTSPVYQQYPALAEGFVGIGLRLD